MHRPEVGKLALAFVDDFVLYFIFCLAVIVAGTEDLITDVVLFLFRVTFLAGRVDFLYQLLYLILVSLVSGFAGTDSSVFGPPAWRL